MSACGKVALVTIFISVKTENACKWYVCVLPVIVCERKEERKTMQESRCLNANNSISKLSLGDGESHGLHGISFSGIPNCLLLFFHSLFKSTDCERLYCFPCHLSCIHHKSLHSAGKTSGADKVLPAFCSDVHLTFCISLRYFNIQSPTS